MSNVIDPLLKFGVFGENPGATPKYAQNKGERRDDFTQTMARLFVPIGATEYARFVQSVESIAPDTAPLARVLAGNGKTGGTGYVDFLLQDAAHGLQEKVDVVELLSDNFVSYFFGQAAATWQYSGTLINTVQDDQAVNFFRVYRDVIRGTMLAARNKLVRLKYDSLYVYGALTSVNWALKAGNESACPFSFTLLVNRVVLVTNPNYSLVRTLEDTPEAILEQQIVLLGNSDGPSLVAPPLAPTPVTAPSVDELARRTPAAGAVSTLVSIAGLLSMDVSTATPPDFLGGGSIE